MHLPQVVTPSAAIIEVIEFGLSLEAARDLVNRLHDEGWQDVDWEQDNDPDTHEDRTFSVTAQRLSCTCATCRVTRAPEVAEKTRRKR